jgi:hypothetical protein
MELRKRFYQKDVKDPEDIFAAKQLIALATSSPPEFSDSSREFVSDSSTEELDGQKDQGVQEDQEFQEFQEDQEFQEFQEFQEDQEDLDEEEEDLVVAIEEDSGEKVVPFSDFDYLFTCTVVFITVYFFLSCFTFLLRSVDI